MSTSKEIITRALNTTNFASAIHEDLSDLVTMLTPKDTPLFARLGRGKATALTHEWMETTLIGPNATSAVYGDGGTPAEHTNSHARRGSKVMSLGRIAKATELLQATNTVGQDAYATEFQEKMVDLMRAIEWFIYNGDEANTTPQEMSGIVALSAGFQSVANGGAALVQAKLDELIVKLYESGGSPDLIIARPIVAQRIANFTADKIRYVTGGGAVGVGPQTLTYLSPLGPQLEILPVRADFLPSGAVYVVESGKIKLCSLGDGPEIKVKELPIDGDVTAKTLIKSYLTLEVRALAHHGKLTGVTDSL